MRDDARNDPGSKSSGVLRFMRWVGAHELLVLGSLALIAACIAGFERLAALVQGDSTLALDTRLLLALRTPGDPNNPLGPPWLEEAARDLTALGSTSVLFLVLFGACCYLLLKGRWRTTLYVALSVCGGVALSFLLKSGFDRPRPDLVSHQAEVFTSSFPSSHAMAAAVAYLTLGAVLARSESSRRVKAFLMGAAALLTLIVGVSRVYLGVHWPSDVLAGWVAGAGWALGVWFVARVLQRRNTLDAEGDDCG